MEVTKMSAIVCRKRSFFEELPSSLSISKRVRFSSSPVRTCPWRSSPGSTAPLSNSLLDHLIVLFPDRDEKVVERALEQSGDDLELAIKSLNNAANNSDIPPQAIDHLEEEQVTSSSKQEASTVEDPLATTWSNCPPIDRDGAVWVELLVTKMASATTLDDARARAGRTLEALEKSICARAETTAKTFQQENAIHKEQVQLLLQENAILKRAVSIQHERQKEFNDKTQELQQLKQLVAQYQEQVRTLEINNYAMTMHLNQALQEGSSFPGRFNPDVF